MPDHQLKRPQKTYQRPLSLEILQSCITSFYWSQLQPSRAFFKEEVLICCSLINSPIVCFSCRAQRACSQMLSHNDGKSWRVWDMQKPRVSSHFYNSCSKEQQTWNGIFLNQVWDKTQSRFPSLSKHPHPGLILCLLFFKVPSSPNCFETCSPLFQCFYSWWR